MPRTFNRATIVGYCGGDPVVKEFEDGRLSCKFNVATSNMWRDRLTGERKEVTQWHRVVVFGPYAHWCEQLLKRGARVFVEGMIRYWRMKTAEGREISGTEIVIGKEGTIVFLDGRREVTKRRRLPGEAFDPFEGEEKEESENGSGKIDSPSGGGDEA